MPEKKALAAAGKTKPKRKPDWSFLACAMLLLGIGIIMVFSSSHYFASYDYEDPYFFLKEQGKFALIGLFCMFLAYKVNMRAYRKLSYSVYVVILGLLIFMVASSNIETIGGAQRWLQIGGFSFQPSELSKIALPMVLAKWISDRRDSVEDFKIGFLPTLGLTGLTAGLILLQKDLSSAIVVAGAGFVIMFCAGVRIPYLIGTFGLGIMACVAAIMLEGFRIERITAWLDPRSDPLGAGYQTIQSWLALGSGGLTGVGLGNGGSKWFYLPARHTDFIFSVLGEELGFLGCLVVIILFTLLIWRGVLIAVRAKDLYSSLLAIGLISAIGIQTFINLGVSTGLLPVTGVTLPLISYGGTSLVVSLTMIGILMNISRRTAR
ncbi:MAG: putative lipid II flippase FtsW [Bacillota bacterium]|nr:putative lipid II flippase FtsW [Bacillota bacterium]